MIILKNQITEVVRLMEQTSNLFYRRNNQEGYLSLNQTLQSLMQLVTDIISYQAEVNINIIEVDRLNTLLGQAMSAIENKDMILLSDLFIFELTPLFEQVKCNIADVKD